MTDAYAFLYNGTLIVIGVLLLFCLIRAIRGPRIADRVISINMMGTLIVITICVLAFLMNEGYLVDIAMIYTMLSFLAVVLLTKIYMGVYREKRRRREAAGGAGSPQSPGRPGGGRPVAAGSHELCGGLPNARVLRPDLRRAGSDDE